MKTEPTSKRRSAQLPRPSPSLLAFFYVYLHWYMGRHFHALRLAHAARFPSHDGPVILYLNHASWWDPLTCILLARRLRSHADNYAPMDAAALKHYGFMRNLGLFPVEQGTARGAAEFFRASREILLERKANLWITPQGTFTDVRPRPVAFRPGLSALLDRLPSAVVVPLAIEYAFWNERLPEVLTNVGEPVLCGRDHPLVPGDLEKSLAAAQDELATMSVARNPGPFETVLAGGSGISGIYQLWQRLRATATGREYHGEHGSIHHP